MQGRFVTTQSWIPNKFILSTVEKPSTSYKPSTSTSDTPSTSTADTPSTSTTTDKRTTSNTTDAFKSVPVNDVEAEYLIRNAHLAYMAAEKASLCRVHAERDGTVRYQQFLI